MDAKTLIALKGSIAKWEVDFADAFTTPINDLRKTDRPEATRFARAELDFLRSLLPKEIAP